MTEPNTPNIGLIVPNTGDLVGAWGTAALNPNFSVIDGYFGGAIAFSVSAATTITLTSPSGSITPTGGVTQSQVASIGLLGTLTGNSVIQLTIPGIYRFNNATIAGSNYIQLTAAGTTTGLDQGIPDGKFSQFFFDSVNVFPIDYPDPATIVNMCVSTIPAWFSGCSVPPYLLANGAIYSTSSFPVLGAKLGSTFGGNGITTFGVPDAQSRAFLMLDVSGVNRVTSGGSGISGNVLGATGGNELLQGHSHANSLNDPGHSHPPSGGATSFVETSGSGTGFPVNSLGVTLILPGNTGTATTGMSINNAVAGGGSSQNMSPAYVGGLTFIKT